MLRANKFVSFKERSKNIVYVTAYFLHSRLGDQLSKPLKWFVDVLMRGIGRERCVLRNVQKLVSKI